MRGDLESSLKDEPIAVKPEAIEAKA
jgi:hypothetical protein